MILIFRMKILFRFSISFYFQYYLVQSSVYKNIIHFWFLHSITRSKPYIQKSLKSYNIGID